MIRAGRKLSAAAIAACGLALALPLPATADEFDDLFDDESATEIEEAPVVENSVREMFAENPFAWSGDISAEAGTSVGYSDYANEIEDWDDPDENLLLGLKARLSFDARPSGDFRVFGKFTIDYPFSESAVDSDSTPTATSTVSVANVGVYELFADFDWSDRVFFRVGKQNLGWGVSRFYQIADPLSVGVKDPTNPSTDLEGPTAVKVSIPFGLNSLTFVASVKESYLPKEAADASVKDVGYGAKADFFVELPKNKYVGNGQLSVGAFAQRDLATKAVASYSTSVGKFQIFTDQVVSFGLDSYRLTGDKATVSTPGGKVKMPFEDTERPDSTPFWSATAGTMYVNNDWHFTLYAEYLFNGAGSTDEDYYADFLTRLGAETMSGSALEKTLSAGDIGGYLARHNSGLSLSWSELFGNDKFGCSAVWLQNWVDRSGTVRPSLTWKPFSHFTMETGANFVWGDDDDEWVIKYTPQGKDPVRTAGYVSFKLTEGKF
jgi:hypothetical protein